jgi:enterochelin esterase family protein
MKEMRILAILLLCAAACFAQSTGQEMVNSPQVNADRTVTFRIRAPKAQEVTLTGDWMPEGTVARMTKDEQGNWSLTAGPLGPGMVIYNFNIDGVAVADPINPRIKLRAQTSASLVNVPGDGSEAFVVRDVPHGLVRIQWHLSKALDGQTREFRVYTPPGYDENAAMRYPVLYLLHGSNDTAAGWTDAGQANVIMDNLIADKKAVPMIVVMPWGHAAPYRAPNNNALFEKYLLQDVIPLVDKTYRVLPGRENRALVGLSMGGEQSLSIGLTHLDLFATIGAFSPSIPRDAETTLKPVLDGRSRTNSMLKLLWIGCGKQEPRFGSNEQFVKLLADHEISSRFVGLDGLHNFTLWRKFLIEMTPLMFRDAR